MKALITSREGLLAGVILALITLIAFRFPAFVAPRNLANVFNDTSPLILLALGQMIVILTKCIDLSVAANLALTGMVAALLTPFVRDGMELKAFVHVNAPGMGGLGLFPRFLCGVDILHPSGSQQQHFRLGAVELIERTLGSPDFQAIIGRDSLSRCVFTFDGPANTFSLSY